MIVEKIQISEQSSLTAYLWDNSTELAVLSRPTVLVIPGGGYMMCSDREAEPLAYSYVAEGFNAFVLRYTCRKDFDTPYKEAEMALRIICENSEKWNVDSARLVVCGSSAGAHLAFALGTAKNRMPKAMILCYPPVIEEDWKHINPAIPGLIDNINEKTCPAFIVACADDSLVPVNNSIEIAGRLNNSGIPFECHIYPKGGHGFGLHKKHTAAGNKDLENERVAEWFKNSVAFIKDVVGDVEIIPTPVLPEDYSAALDKPLGELLENQKTKAVLLKYSLAFENEQILMMGKDFPVSSFVMQLGISADDVKNMSYELEAALK